MHLEMGIDEREMVTNFLCHSNICNRVIVHSPAMTTHGFRSRFRPTDGGRVFVRNVVIIWHFHHKYHSMVGQPATHLVANYHRIDMIVYLFWCWSTTTTTKTFRFFLLFFVFYFAAAGESSIYSQVNQLIRWFDDATAVQSIANDVENNRFRVRLPFELYVAIDRTTPNMWHTRNCVKHFVVINSEHNWCERGQLGIVQLEFIYLRFILLSIIQQGIDHSSILRLSQSACVKYSNSTIMNYGRKTPTTSYTRSTASIHSTGR